MASPLVKAAGAVVWRPVAPSVPASDNGRDDGDVEVLVVHRPRYDDWSMPKGKLDDGEGFEAAAVREVAEETGVHGRLGADLGEVHYIDHRGRPKVVRWWAMRAETVGAPTDVEEVDELRWVTPQEAADLLSYDSDAAVLERFRATVGR